MQYYVYRSFMSLRTKKLWKWTVINMRQVPETRKYYRNGRGGWRIGVLGGLWVRKKKRKEKEK